MKPIEALGPTVSPHPRHPRREKTKGGCTDIYCPFLYAYRNITAGEGAAIGWSRKRIDVRTPVTDLPLPFV